MAAQDFVAELMEVIVQEVPGISPENAAALERRIRMEWNGTRPYIGVRNLKRQMAVEALKSGADAKAVRTELGLSRATMYEYLKLKPRGN